MILHHDEVMMCSGAQPAIDPTESGNDGDDRVPVLVVDDQAPFLDAARAVIARVRNFDADHHRCPSGDDGDLGVHLHRGRDATRRPNLRSVRLRQQR